MPKGPDQMADYDFDDVISRIRQAADIVDIVAERVSLRPRGSRFVGLCPFHEEKTPSFSVDRDKGLYYCFGCGVGGDVFDFLIRADGISFREAADFLAQKYGLPPLPSGRAGRMDKRTAKRESILDINSAALSYFKNRLKDPVAGKAARDYLLARGYPFGIVDAFSLGYAPAGWDSLLLHLKRKGYPEELAAEAGLVVERKDKSGYYDRFRNRIIFPIIDVTGAVVAFGGRVMDDSQPKYLNSPETRVYHKGKVLYGLNRAKDACRRSGSIFVVEGYFDLIAMHAHGYENSVASLGTAFTGDHLKRIQGLVKRVYLLFDSDEAGVKAASRCAPLFLSRAIEALVVLLPEGEDPDSFLASHGREAFDACVSEAMGLIPFLVKSGIKRYGAGPEGRLRLVEELVPVLCSIEDPVALSVWIEQVADLIGIDEGSLRQRIAKNLDTVRRRNASAQAGAGRNQGGRDERGNASDKLEQMLISLMLHRSDLVGEIVAQGLIDSFENLGLKSLAELIARDPECGVDSLLLETDESLHPVIARLSMETEEWDDASAKRLLRQFKMIKKRGNSELLEKIRKAEMQNDHEMLKILLREMQNRAALRRS